MEMKILTVFVIVFFTGWAAYKFLNEYLGTKSRVSEVEKKNVELTSKIDGLEQRMTKLEEANRKKMPYASQEELDHMMAEIVLLEADLQRKQTYIDSIRAHAELARNNRRSGEL